MFSFKRGIDKARSIETGKSQIHGNGVLARHSFKKGDIIEKAPLILLDKTERDLLQNTILFDYYFLLNHAETPVALALGMASLYNHAVNPNASYIVQQKNALLIIKALVPIAAGEEVTINYNGTPGDDTPVYFQNK